MWEAVEVRLHALMSWLTFVGHFPEGFGAGGISPRPRHEARPEAQRLARVWVRVSRETGGAGDLFVPLRGQAAARRHSAHTDTPNWLRKLLLGVQAIQFQTGEPS
jgi:hypothetical protein